MQFKAVSDYCAITLISPADHDVEYGKKLEYTFRKVQSGFSPYKGIRIHIFK